MKIAELKVLCTTEGSSSITAPTLLPLLMWHILRCAKIQGFYSQELTYTCVSVYPVTENSLI
jgi:hypothetical protein